MNQLGWAADGIARALACGAVELEKYRKPGFVGGVGVRRSQQGGPGGGFDASWDYDPYDDDDWEDAARRQVARR